MKFDTSCVRAGMEPDPSTGAIVPPIYQTATYVLEEIGKDRGFDYTRSSNPTRQNLEQNLSSLEAGRFGVAFSSGMAAVDSVLRLLSAGDHVVSSDDVYGGVSRLMTRVLNRFGVETTFVDSSDAANVEAAIRPETRMIWLETPTNPLLKITDLEAVAAIGKRRGIPVAVDSTFATPALLRPLEWGADLVVQSTTKYIGGHNHIIGGAVITNDAEWAEGLRFIQKSVGAVPSPFDCWLTLMGIKTLHLRMARHSENGLRVARWLEAQPKIGRVAYPGLESHPGHEVARRQMSGFSGMISFELTGGLDAGKILMNSVELCALAESLGAVETMITHPATMTHAEVPVDERRARGLSDGLVRLSVGIEDVEDIIADLSAALQRC